LASTMMSAGSLASTMMSAGSLASTMISAGSLASTMMSAGSVASTMMSMRFAVVTMMSMMSMVSMMMSMVSFDGFLSMMMVVLTLPFGFDDTFNHNSRDSERSSLDKTFENRAVVSSLEVFEHKFVAERVDMRPEFEEPAFSLSFEVHFLLFHQLSLIQIFHFLSFEGSEQASNIFLSNSSNIRILNRANIFSSSSNGDFGIDIGEFVNIFSKIFDNPFLAASMMMVMSFHSFSHDGLSNNHSNFFHKTLSTIAVIINFRPHLNKFFSYLIDSPNKSIPNMLFDFTHLSLVSLRSLQILHCLIFEGFKLLKGNSSEIVKEI